MEDELLLALEDEHHASLLLVLEGPEHPEAIQQLAVDLYGIEDLAVALGVAELDHA